jgi:hypothetical protein
MCREKDRRNEGFQFSEECRDGRETLDRQTGCSISACQSGHCEEMALEGYRASLLRVGARIKYNPRECAAWLESRRSDGQQ